MIPKLPSYSDQENSVFHPAFEYALNEALKIRQAEHIEIRKQYQSPTGPIDLILFNTQTQKVILPIEIKRTQSNVRGGGRRQARDYWQNLGTKCETPFYCVSNLELIELFRYDESRPKTSAQQIKLENPIIGSLASSLGDENFYLKLINSISEMLNIVFNKQKYIYITGLPELQNNLEIAVNDYHQWHKILIPACFEYIRGAATRIENLRKYELKPAKFYSENPNRLIDIGKKIDFEHIFKDPVPEANDSIIFSNIILTEAYRAGKELGDGDEIAELINEILTDYIPKKQGIVETDTELARLLSIIAKVTLGRELKENESIIDPASGSGRLLTALYQTSFTNISPKQIKAIEKEPLFSESLSLRLGLVFGTNISKSNSPSIIIQGIEDVDKSFFDNVKIVVMNPPFISGVQSKKIKKTFSNRIHKISGEKSKLNIGQVALEILFLELVCNLVPDGTVISLIYPSNHLYRASKEMSAFRNYLLDQFGLSYIVTYPRKGLFSSVIKGTVILSGIKGKKVKDIKLIEVLNTVNNIQFDEFCNYISVNSIPSKKTKNPTNSEDASLKIISRSYLKSTSDFGWQEIMGTGSGIKAKNFIEKYIVEDKNPTSFKIKRGNFGNNGNNPLTVISKDHQKYQYPTVLSKIPLDWFISLLNNTDNMPRVVTKNSSAHDSFIPTDKAYTPNTRESDLLDLIITEYLCKFSHTQGAQKKELPNKDNIIKSLRKNGRIKYSNLILLPRASRVKGQVGIVENDPILISTNVLLIESKNINHAKLMGSWLLSVFGQLQLELYGISQEGMRKLEVNTLNKIKFPNFELIENRKAKELITLFYSEDSIDFRNIQQRQLDRAWSEVLSPDEPIALTNEVFDIFQELVDNRIGLG